MFNWTGECVIFEMIQSFQCFSESKLWNSKERTNKAEYNEKVES